MSENPAFKSHTTIEEAALESDTHVWPEQLAWEATLAVLTGLTSGNKCNLNDAAQWATELGRQTAELFCATKQS